MPVRLNILKEKPKNYKGERLSVSKVKVFDKCPASFKYTYRDRLPKKDWAHSVFGNFAHEVLERFDKERMAGNEDPDHKLMSHCFEKILKKTNKELSKKGKPPELLDDEAVDDAFEIFGKYLTKIAQEKKEGRYPKTVGVEVPFWIEINDSILLSGLIDKVQIDPDGMLHVKDYKTAASKHYRKYFKKDWLQLQTYAFVKFLMNPEIDEIRASYEFLRFDFDVIEKVFKRKDTIKVVDKFLNYARKIEQEKLFRPNPTPLCEYCDQLDICEEGKAFMLEHKDYMLKHGLTDW